MSEVISVPKVRQDLLNNLDLSSPSGVLAFGVEAQQHATEAANALLAATKTKDMGEAGDALNQMLLTLNGFDPAEAKEKGFFGRLFSDAKRDLATRVAKFQTVKDHVEDIKGRMDQQKTTLLTDIDTIETMYGRTLQWFHALEDHIATGEHAIGQTKTELDALAEAAKDPHASVLAGQRLADKQAVHDELERRVHDLRLTRQVVMQFLPSLRLVQENDRALVTKINSVLTNTVPLWIQQMAQAILIQRMSETGKTVQAAADLTNKLLTQNADMLRQGNATTRQQIERGVFDVEAVVKANQTLVETLRDTVRIAQEAKAKRVQAKGLLNKAEADIKQALREMKTAA